MRINLVTVLAGALLGNSIGAVAASQYEGYWRIATPAAANRPTLSQTIRIRPAGDAFIVEMITLNPVVKEYEVQELAGVLRGGALSVPYRYDPGPILLDPDRGVLVGSFCKPNCLRTDANAHEATRKFAKTYKAPRLSDFLKD